MTGNSSSSAAHRPRPQGLRQASLRDANLALVNRSIAAATVPPSRADLALATGLTRSTVSRLVDVLIASRLVAELEPVFSSAPGRPAVPLVPARNSHAGLGIEVNAAHLSVRLVDLSGAVLAAELREADYIGADPRTVLAETASLVHDVLQGGFPGPIVGAHLALPGLVDAERGILLRAPNLGWTDVRPAEFLTPELLGVPLNMGNEADYAALTIAQTAPGRAGDVADFLYVSGEVGIGSAAVRGGRVQAGSRGWAGELGHLTVDPQGPRCNCGSTGCLETYVGQAAMLRSAGAAAPRELVAGLESGEPTAVEATRRAAEALGMALASTLNLLDISTVILGGHLADLEPFIGPALIAEMESRVLWADYCPISVIRGSLDHAPASLGAAYASLAGAIADPARWTGPS